MKTDKLTAPTAFRDYLLIGDTSSISEADKQEADSWLAFIAPFVPVAVADDDPGGEGQYGFFHRPPEVVPVTQYRCEAPDDEDE